VGVLYYSSGSEVLSFVWGLGLASNNQAKAMVFYVGLKLINEEHYKDLVVIRDSKFVINGLQHPQKCDQLSLQRNYQRIFQEGGGGGDSFNSILSCP
jgi:ribonuclease HI